MADQTRATVQTIYQCYKTLFGMDVADFEQHKIKLSIPVIPVPLLSKICAEASRLFNEEPLVLDITGDVVVVGDLHGHLLDLFRILKKFGSPSKQRYVFLGDLVDRGEFSIETLTLVFVMKILWPQNVYLIRGNHEFTTLWSSCGFLNEVTTLYGNDSVIHEISHALAFVPIAARVNQKNLCLHGGIGPEFTSVSQLEQLRRPIYEFSEEPLQSLLWSDPDAKCEGYRPSTRGSGFIFGEKETMKFLEDNNLELLIRGHQCTDDGCDFMFDDHLVTVFSCSNYCGIAGNKAGVLVLKEDGSREAVRMEALDYFQRGLASLMLSASEHSFSLSGAVMMQPQAILPQLEHPRRALCKMAQNSSVKTLPRFAEAETLMARRSLRDLARVSLEPQAKQLPLDSKRTKKLSLTSGEFDLRASSPSSGFRILKKRGHDDDAKPSILKPLPAKKKA